MTAGSLRLTLMVATVLPLAACALKSDMPPPTLAAPAASWIDGAGSAGPAPAADWWTGFGSPELSRLMAAMETQGLDLPAAVARIQEADAQARIAGAALLPSLAGSAGATRSLEATPALRGSGSGPTVYSNDFTSSLATSYEVDFWGRNAASLAAARASATFARYDEGVVQLTAEASLADSFFDYLGTADRLTLARRDLAAAVEIRDAISDEVKLGIATSVDLAQQETVVANTRAGIPPLEQQARTDLTAIAILVGRTPEALKLAGVSLDGLKVPPVSPGLPSDLLARRPDVREAEANLAAADADIVVARAAFLPTIALTGSGGYASDALNRLFLPGSLLASAGGSLAQPIFSGGSLEGQLAYSRARYQELLADYRKSALSAFSDVENALIAVQKTAEEDQDQNVAVAAARDAYEQVQDQLKGGVAKITDVLNTEQSLFSAENAQLEVRENRLEATVALIKALGGGWQEPPAR